ncbi:hypothetical protein EV363DRAFT_1453216 [Boletus edulis]|nr:hypothetical protein EV363DRAFT_1453216 [Boletus edulis]
MPLSKYFDLLKDGDQEKKKVGKLKKSQGRCQDDVIEKILLPNGTVWIPEVQNLTRKVPQEKGQLGKSLIKNMLRVAKSSTIPQRRYQGIGKGVEAEEA